MQEHIPQWQASHLTQAEYCKTHGIKPHIFSYYKKKFAAAPAAAKKDKLMPVKCTIRYLMHGFLIKN
jgi:hypothetical protein